MWKKVLGPTLVVSLCWVLVGAATSIVCAGHSEELSAPARLLQVFFFFAGPATGILMGFWVGRSLYRSNYEVSVNLQDGSVEVDQSIGKMRLESAGELRALEDQIQAVSNRITQVVHELKEERQEAERADPLAAVGELAAGVAHELRNPLTSVKLLIQTAALKYRDRPLTDKQLQVLQDEIGRMENTIQGLLDFARPPRLHRARHDLRDVLRRGLNLIRPRADQLGVNIIEEVLLPLTIIDGDPEQLYQVFLNLLLNGMESMPDGGTLRITLGESTTIEHGCRIEFCDTGSGIPADLMDRLFEPFVTGKEQGYGLGLAMSRRIVKEHGGAITAATRPGGGAIFTVELPLSPMDAGGAAGETSAQQSCSESEDVQAAGHR